MSDRLESEVFDPDNPPPSSVLLSIGTDSSDLIVTNGFRIWQRSMPIGGNHFTRQLTKDLKLTFAKAEHLKRNAREAVDPKLVFQTMRPVFNDLVTEVQRSIGFFRSIDKKAEITELLLTGNTVKMPGLAAYLGKNLGFEVHVLDRFNRLVGDDVLTIPTFRDNAPTFAVCYGLCLQGLGLSQINASVGAARDFDGADDPSQETLDVGRLGGFDDRHGRPLRLHRTKLADNASGPLAGCHD